VNASVLHEGRVEAEEEQGRADLLQLASIHAVDDMSHSFDTLGSGWCASASRLCSLGIGTEYWFLQSDSQCRTLTGGSNV
jgi:hypothetical protein